MLMTLPATTYEAHHNSAYPWLRNRVRIVANCGQEHFPKARLLEHDIDASDVERHMLA